MPSVRWTMPEPALLLLGGGSARAAVAAHGEFPGVFSSQARQFIIQPVAIRHRLIAR